VIRWITRLYSSLSARRLQGDCYYVRCKTRRDTNVQARYGREPSSVEATFVPTNSLRCVYCWAIGLTVRQTHIETKIQESVISRYFKRIREAVVLRVLECGKGIMIGGDNVIVEIDESKFGKQNRPVVTLVIESNPVTPDCLGRIVYAQP